MRAGVENRTNRATALSGRGVRAGVSAAGRSWHRGRRVAKGAGPTCEPRTTRVEVGGGGHPKFHILKVVAARTPLTGSLRIGN